MTRTSLIPHPFPLLGEACTVAPGLGERFFDSGAGVGTGMGSFTPAVVRARTSSAAVHVRAETMPVIALPSPEVKPS